MASAENGMSSRVLFQGDASFPFSRGGGDQAAGRKPSATAAAAPSFALSGDKLFSGHRDARFFRLDDEDEEDDDDDVDEEEEDEDVDEGDGLVSVDEVNHKAGNNSSGSVQSSSEKIHGERENSQEHHFSFGFSRGTMGKDVNDGRRNLNEEHYQRGPMDGYENAITVVEPEPYYSHVLNQENGSPAPSQKEVAEENGCGLSVRREGLVAAGYWESLRTHLSDPLTGTLMDDAMILPCGHSFGSSGMQHVYRMKACCKCAQSISEDSVRPNFALRSAVQAFLREEESHSLKASKRKRDRLELEKCGYDDPSHVDFSRGKGVQFPFAVSDRVIIKGNKRTPHRFVGRMAIVTTQCLNGWYVVKTLDNAESVKLQYRSLAKVSDDQASSIIPNKTHNPNWL
ncbi:U-box domain-containing protein 62-like isoform X1 [Ananas comosus]|uniref:U-box domain-containing protein 62-like isoform X1 n=1 Tax=Ananas comosus TaxID=4615 RepID=A0A6P5H0R9_ANACO|nr:U-box domain-containing protein 62-like isoform X1 [Ananas comosus]